MVAVVPAREADVSETVFPFATVLSPYWATRPESATFEGVLASPAGTLTNESALLSVKVIAVVRSYVFVNEVIREPPIVKGRDVIFADKVGKVNE